MLYQQKEALTRRVRETLQSGRSIAVLGWNSHNHNPFTRELPDKRIVFYESLPTTHLGDRIGLIILTRYMDHTVTCRIKKEKPACTCSTVVEVRQIREILGSCADLLNPPSCKPKVNGGVPKVLPSEPAIKTLMMIIEMDPAFLDFWTTPTRRYEMNTHEIFTKAFLAAADKEGRVDKTTLSRLLKECEIKTTPARLIRAGWLVGEVSPNKTKIGRYKAGEKMRATSTQETLEPEDPIERAKFIIGQKESFLAEEMCLKAEYEEKLESVKKKLARIETAERLLEQLKAL